MRVGRQVAGILKISGGKGFGESRMNGAQRLARVTDRGEAAPKSSATSNPRWKHRSAGERWCSG